MSFAKAICACAAFGVMSTAHAGIMDMDWSATTDLTGVLDLAPDGVWNEGDDYSYEDHLVELSENWIGGFGDTVEFDISVMFDNGTPRTPVPDISFNKMVTNNTNFFWSSFQIVITPGVGSTIMDVFANPNDEFGDVMVSMGNNGAWTILWSQNGGTGVAQGDSTSFEFGFNISGNLGFMLKQTPIPAPSAAALLGLAGLAGVRRRR